MSEPSPPRAMSRTPLPAPPPPGDDMIAAVTLMLDRQPLPADLQARHLAPDAVAARAEAAARRSAEDWPALARYRADNAQVDRPALVMIGDSLTEIWGLAAPDMFGRGIVNRGISGQTSGQILLRFMADVVDLAPAGVHILCGTNDIAGNTGPTTPEDYQRNIRAMVDLAQAHGIAVLLASIPPAAAIFWSPDARPRKWIPQLNGWLRDLCEHRGLTYVDYHTLLDDGEGALQPHYSADGVHVSRAAYGAMRALLERHR